MKPPIPILTWLGLGLALFFWLAESLMHTLVFDHRPLAETLIAEYDPNELWMRLLISLAFLAFGWAADKSVRAERQLKEDAQRLNRLLRFVDHVKLKWPSGQAAGTRAQLRRGAVVSSAAALEPPPGELGAEFALIKDITDYDDEIGRLSRILQQLSGFVEDRFGELHALLQLTHEINKGLLLDEVLDKAYEALQAVLPYDRLSVALLEHGGRLARARWVRARYSDIILPAGYARSIKGSSLQGIIASGEPRIINDLSDYLRKHPLSESTDVMVAEGIRASLTCPLISIGKPIGFMFFSSRTPNTYQDVHIDIFRLIAGHLSVMVEKSNLYQQLLRETEKSESLLLNVMPSRIATRLSAGAKSIAESLPRVNVLFVDIVGFTAFASRHAPEQVLNLLENIFVPLDRLCELHRVEKIKTSGDQYMVIAAAADATGDHALTHLADFALEALPTVGAMRYPDGRPVQIRLGMHCGPAVAGVIGQTKFAYDIWGDAVNIASRMESSGEAGRVHVTEDVYAQLREQFAFEERGVVEIRGKGSMQTYFLNARK